MYDYGLSVLEQYDLEAVSSRRGRGSLLCETAQGLKIISEWHGSEKKLVLQRSLQKKLRENAVMVDLVLENRDETLLCEDSFGIRYIVRDWYQGRECDARSRGDVLAAARALAGLHMKMRLSAKELAEYKSMESLSVECRRHNQEIRRVGTYIRKKRRKTEFERSLLTCLDRFLSYGEEAAEALDTDVCRRLEREAEEKGYICHGECNQHNLLLIEGTWILVNYEHLYCGCQMADLYQFMRKVLEKNSWSRRLGRDMVRAYQREKPLSREEFENLALRLSYPWKFWKLVNYYAGNSHRWLAARSQSKLDSLLRQEVLWREFCRDMIS